MDPSAPAGAQSSPEELLRRLGVASSNAPSVELVHNRRLTPGVWRMTLADGRAAVLKHQRAERDPGRTPWDAHWTAGDDEPRRWNHWAREPLAYAEHLTDVYADAGLHAPRCLAAEIGEHDAILLLEWVDGVPGEAWPVAGYAVAAEALGRAQGAFLAGRPLPERTWLSRGFLREYSSEKPVDWALLDDDEAWAHPVARATLPAQLRESVRFVHRNRERLYRIGEALPRTLCHLDVWPKNLIRAADGRIVLIDWAFVGDGSIGEDAGNLVPDACFDHFVAAADLPELERVVHDHHLSGLRAAGWDGDPRLLQLGMWASAVKYDWLAALTLAQLREPRQERYGGEGEIDAAFRFGERGRALLFTARWARQAIELADRLGVATGRPPAGDQPVEPVSGP